MSTISLTLGSYANSVSGVYLGGLERRSVVSGDDFCTIRATSASARETMHSGYDVSVLSGWRSHKVQRREPGLKVKRRLRGFFIQEEGDDARVAFVENNSLVHYHLPAKLLRDADIWAENQPFEVDEVETVIEGVNLTGYKFRPAAPADSGRITPLRLDEERERKLKRILAREKKC